MMVSYYFNYKLLFIFLILDEEFQNNEGIWGTDVFTAFELKKLTRRIERFLFLILFLIIF